jgi:hypothetical protein
LVHTVGKLETRPIFSSNEKRWTGGTDVFMW